MVESLFRDRTVSWVRIVNGIDKYVTETSETISLENVEHRVTKKPVTKAKPQPKPTVTLSPISLLVRERNDMIHQFLEKMMEQYDLTIFWKNQGKVRWYFAETVSRLRRTENGVDNSSKTDLTHCRFPDV